MDKTESQRQLDFAVFDEVTAAFSDVPADELERQLAKAIAEVRAESGGSRSATANRAQHAPRWKRKS